VLASGQVPLCDKAESSGHVCVLGGYGGLQGG